MPRLPIPDVDARINRLRLWRQLNDWLLAEPSLSDLWEYA